MTTVFEKIIQGELPCDKVYEDDEIIAFKDIAPKAPIHILIVSKKVIPSLQQVENQDFPMICNMLKVAQQLAKQFKLENGYRLVTNVGRDGGQEVYHLHFHLLGGCSLNDEMF